MTAKSYLKYVRQMFNREQDLNKMNLLTSFVSKGISKLSLCDCSRPPFLNHNFVMRNGGLERPFEPTEKEIALMYEFHFSIGNHGKRLSVLPLVFLLKGFAVVYFE
ncbi:MAG: hypothetical protein KC900_12575 [Candidatus Omnitrophica bacterium]|nr:hypothetical protein [Candidatus Omnitrophota bacterium]